MKLIVLSFLSMSCAALGIGCGKSNGAVSTAIDAGSEPPMRPRSPATWDDAGAGTDENGMDAFCMDGTCMGGTGMGGPCAGGTGMSGTCMGGTGMGGDQMSTCGGMVCYPGPGLAEEFAGGDFQDIDGCCFDAATRRCGTMIVGSGVCVPPPELDYRCPKYRRIYKTGTVITSTSCCTAGGQCGVDALLLGMGCVDYATVRSGPLNDFYSVPDPIACDAAGEDAGI